MLDIKEENPGSRKNELALATAEPTIQKEIAAIKSGCDKRSVICLEVEIITKPMPGIRL